MKKKSPDATHTYLSEECRICGECLAACPYIKMDKVRAAAEIRKMRDGIDSFVLERCAGCAVCDTVCSGNCRPYSLIRSRWYERYRESGIPEAAAFLMPYSKPNFHTEISFGPKEIRFIKSLEHMPSSGTVMYTGCNTLSLPQQLKSRVFEDVEVIGSFDWCCGEMYYRSGLFDHARQAGLRMRSLFNKRKIEKMLFVCSACYNMFTNIFPNEFGIGFDFETEFYTGWIADRLDRGLYSIKQPLEKRVIMHDPCHPKWIKGNIREDARRIVAALGGTVVEPSSTMDNALCCGCAAGCAKFSPVDIVASAARRVIELEMAHGDMSLTYCNGCLLTMLSVKQFMPATKPMKPLMEVVQEALGEPSRPWVKHRRARQMVTGIAVNALPKMVTHRNRIKLPDIDTLEN